MTSLKLLLELNSNKSTLISSKDSRTLEVGFGRFRFEKSEIDEIVLVGGSTRIPKSDNLSKNSSTVKNLTPVLILMRPSATVQLSKEVLSVVRTLKMEESLLLMLLHSLWVLKLLVVLWAKLFQKDLTSQPRNHKSSQPIKTIKKLSQFKSLRVKDHSLKITICWEDSIWLVFLQPQEVPLKLKLPSKSIKTQSFPSKPSWERFRKENNIVIKNEQGKLSDEEIERMLREAE